MLVLKLLLSDKYITAWEIAPTLPSSLSSLYLIEHLSPVPLSLPSLPPSSPSPPFISGVLTLLKFPYPRCVEEPECYDSIRVHAEWGQSTQENEKIPTFAVRTVCVCVCVCVCLCVCV